MATYTEDELYQKLARADAAGDVQAAKVIADEIRKNKSSPSFGQSVRAAAEMNPVVAAFRAGPGIVEAARGDAAEEIPSAIGSSTFRDARWDATKDRGYLDNIGREAKEAGAAVFGTDEELGLALANNVPGAKLDRDANGNVVIELASGERVYPNKPGLDAQDVVRFAGNAGSYLPAARVGRWATGLIGRAATTGAGAAATNAAGQKAAGRERVDLGEVGLTGAFGAGGEFAAPVLGKIAQALRSSPARGEVRAARILSQDLGIPQPTKGQVRAFSQALDEIDAGADPAAILGSGEFGFIYTKARRLRDGASGKFAAMTREEALRQDPGMAGDAMRRVDDHNRATLQRIVADQIGDSVDTPVAAFDRIGERVGQMADDLHTRVGSAYEQAGKSGRAVVPIDAVQNVPGRLKEALREYPADPRLTPATRAMLDEISERVSGLQKGTKGVTLRVIEEQRRVINHAFGAAANPTDRSALRVLKAEYDRWLDEAMEGALVSGDPEALAALKEARGLRAEFGRRFEGDKDVDRFIANLIEGEKTPDELLGVALGASHISKASAARFIERLRTASGGDPEVMGALKAAHLMRLFQDKRGEVLGIPAIRNNILTAERETPSVIRSLYGDAQWGQVKRLAQSLGPLIDKGTFARRPGTADQLMRQMMSLPFIGRAIDAVRQPVNIGRAYRATGPLARPPAPASIPATTAAAGDQYRQTQGG